MYHRADAVSIDQAFPGLGAARYVTFGGNRWSAVNAKKPNEKWIYFSIHPLAIPKLTKNQVTNAVEDMKKLGITPIYKSFGTAGPMYTVLFFINNKQEDVIYYFHQKDNALANNLSVLLSTSLGRPINAEFFDPTKDKDDAQKMILETTDLDFFYSMNP